MKKILIIIIFVAAIINSNAQPPFVQFKQQNKIQKQQMFDFRISTNQTNTSFRYDNAEREILDDTLYYSSVDTTADTTIEQAYPYTTNMNMQKYNLHIGFLGLPNFYVYAKLPFVYTNVFEEFKYDSTLSNRYDRNDKSKYYLEGLQFDAGYKIPLMFGNDNLMNINVLGNVFIPFYTYETNIDTTDEPINNKNIQLGRCLEANLGASLDFNIKPMHFQLGAAYNMMGNDAFADRFKANLLIGLASIENTEISINAKYMKSLRDYQSSDAATFWRQVTWQDYVSVDVGFKMFFTDELYVDANYDIIVWGKNTLGKRTINLNVGYILGN
jgi:hypothetical protein